MKYEIKVFAGNTFYPHGGYEDYEASFRFDDINDLFEEIEKAKKFIEHKYDKEYYMWAHLVFPNSICLKGHTEDEKWIWKEYGEG